MRPKKFKQATIELKKPETMTAEGCKRLWVHDDKKQKISLWTTPLLGRIKFLFHGHVWVGVVAGEHPPIWLDCTRTVFFKENK